MNNMRYLIDYLLGRNSSSGNFRSFVILSFRFFCGLMMLPYGYGKIVNYDKYAADFFGDPIGIGDIPSLWLTIFAQTVCPIMLLLGFQTRLSASILAFNMLVAVKYHFFDPFSIKVLPVLFLGLYVIQLLMGAGKYSLDYIFYAKGEKRFYRNEAVALILFMIACGIAWFVLGNCFTGAASAGLAALTVILYSFSLYYVRSDEF